MWPYAPRIPRAYANVSWGVLHMLQLHWCIWSWSISWTSTEIDAHANVATCVMLNALYVWTIQVTACEGARPDSLLSSHDIIRWGDDGLENRDGVRGPIIAVGLNQAHALHNLHTAQHTTENCVLAIQESSWCQCNENCSQTRAQDKRTQTHTCKYEHTTVDNRQNKAGGDKKEITQRCNTHVYTHTHTHTHTQKPLKPTRTLRAICVGTSIGHWQNLQRVMEKEKKKGFEASEQTNMKIRVAMSHTYTHTHTQVL